MDSSVYLKKTSLKGSSKQRITVVIPSLNEIAYLPGLLDALDVQTLIPDDVIVADAGSTDSRAELAQARGARAVRGGMVAVGRNAGARAAGGDLLLFLGADVLPPLYGRSIYTHSAFLGRGRLSKRPPLSLRSPTVGKKINAGAQFIWSEHQTSWYPFVLRDH